MPLIFFDELLFIGPLQYLHWSVCYFFTDMQFYTNLERYVSVAAVNSYLICSGVELVGLL